MAIPEQYAVITGAGAGLGKAYALNLAKNAQQLNLKGILVNDADQENADAVVQSVNSQYGSYGKKDGVLAFSNYDRITSDITSANKIERQALQLFGSVTILINNAGILRDVSFANQTEEQWTEPTVRAKRRWGEGSGDTQRSTPAKKQERTINRKQTQKTS